METRTKVRITGSMAPERFTPNVSSDPFKARRRFVKKKLGRMMNFIRTRTYPVPVESYGILVVLSLLAANTAGKDLTLGLSSLAQENLKVSTTVGCILGSACLWMGLVFLARIAVKFLLSYQGWMFEEKGKGRRVSLATRLWALSLHILCRWQKPLLHSFQGLLPRLPLPKLEDSVQKYLNSMRHLLKEEEYARVEKEAKEFLNGMGPKLQRYLWLKSWWSTNYVSEWWVNLAYLRSREPLMVKSNYYTVDILEDLPPRTQAARAAAAVYSGLLMRRQVQTQRLDPIIIQGLVPLCSDQYERLFNTTRVPGLEMDHILKVDDCDHIAVYNKGRFYKVNFHHNGRLLKPVELQIQFQNILDDTSEPAPGEKYLASLTAGPRTHWAQTRQDFFSSGVNKESLDAIESCIFFLSLDDYEYFHDGFDFSEVSKTGKLLLTGKGYDRWFDKSFTLSVSTNGKMAALAEHAWGDALICSHAWENALIHDTNDVRYDESGNIVDEPEFDPPKPIKLSWDMPEECVERINHAYKIALTKIEDVDQRVVVFSKFGRNFMKYCGVSPDSYVQMALQLAYFRDMGEPGLTYEPAMARLFLHGRTETVRSCTAEAVDWVRAMDDPEVDAKKKAQLLRTACHTHQKAYQQSMVGQAFDRHLFALYVVSKYLNLDSPFLTEALSAEWKLSTSQTPHRQTYRKIPNDLITPGGGFGFCANDGYGVAYMFINDGMLAVHTTSKKSSQKADSFRFTDRIQAAFLDMQTLFLSVSEDNNNAKCDKKDNNNAESVDKKINTDAESTKKLL